MATAIKENKRAMSLLNAPGQVEKVFLWNDDQTGFGCKAKPDKVIDSSEFGPFPVCINLKTTRCQSPAEFAKDFLSLGYHIAARWHQRAVKAVMGATPEIRLIVVEKNFPFAVGEFLLDHDWLLGAEKEIEYLMSKAETLQKEYGSLDFGWGSRVLDAPVWMKADAQESWENKEIKS